MSKLEKKASIELQACVAMRTQEVEMNKIRAVKTKTSEMINKLRRQVNLAIDAINCQ